ncbi:thiamine pyrophosphate-binding protein [Roseovarius sp. A21]|uniref:Thiamine pyrophosphate-binding protein n=1 Tax=Roseovarius bejariae TaxID=2576383 RepID=A0A844D3A4_9RHOB|nr:thiamine pyrophosphate-binding protein [Roseovarius bejariae]MRU16333.1 thiamine pyrophosphate-binding protein [Roseovarius bejariae]
MRGADSLVQTLASAGVTRIFALSGNQIMPIFDACLEAGIELIHTRHEGATVFMAEAYAQLTGQVGVALVTAGGGLANSVGAVASARASDTALLLLSGDSPRGQDGTGAFQEMDQVAITQAVTKWSFRAEAPDGLGADVARAMACARAGQPGPVHLALPFDVVKGAADGAVPVVELTEDRSAPEDVEAVRTLVAEAERPLVLLGPSLTPTRHPGLCDELSAALNAPVFAMESPRGLRDPAMGRIGEVVARADLVLCLGKRVDFTLGFGAGEAGWITVSADEADHAMAAGNLGVRHRAGVVTPALGMARALCDGPVAQVRDDWQAEAARLVSIRPDGTGDGLTSATLCAAVQECVAGCDESVVICDGGEFGQWAQALTRGTARVINGVSGAIGAGLPYAMAAHVARPGATVFALSGDGSIGFHFAEFETAARHGLPFVMVIGNDQRWNAEHQIQLRDYGEERLSGCGLTAARYDLAAEAMGAHGEFVTHAADLRPALERAVASGKPACVNVMIEGLPAPVV